MFVIIVGWGASDHQHWKMDGSHQIRNGGTNTSNSIRKVDWAKVTQKLDIRTMVIVLLQVVSHIRAISLLEIPLLPSKWWLTKCTRIDFCVITIQVNAVDVTMRN